MAKTLLRTDNIVKDYFVGTQVIRALKGVSAEIQSGEFVAIMGPSGSGKSTYMNLLGCLDKPTKGKYILEGEDISALGRDQLAHIRNTKIGFVFQTFNLLPRTTALENVALPLVYGRTPRRERQKKALAVLEAVGLSGRAHHVPSQLSGGQQQRVAIARALVNSPKIILADEPTGALDTRTGIEIMSLLQSLNSNGITIVVVTHEIEIARFAKRVLRFRDGRIVGDGNMDSDSE
ncbi:MAG: macrolide ABC transporter ATP-binding protein [Deltaproteobacteria bacterium]|nr:ABC transporter ATP-binding protein [Deltaproteobacteria bacterium]RLB32808.1 MAG: macrolide ABC transporter ATP-binding protein [Deltaproteobacteria bacterium]